MPHYATVKKLTAWSKKTAVFFRSLNLLLPKIILLSCLIITSCTTLPPNSEIIQYYEVSTHKPYAEVLSELQIAIAEHNFRITGHSRVGKVIRERGTPDFPEYDTLQFCNLTHAKTLLLMSPHSVRHMPCNVVTYIYQGKTIVKTHLMPTDTDNPELNQFSAIMNQMLKEIVDFAIAH
jgi:uncharacterized protein (DUF302 family)